MKISFIVISVLLILSMLQEKSHSGKKEKVFTVYVKDTIPVVVNLIYEDGMPHSYQSSVVTPVCDEGICFILELEVYWDLLGNFMNYREIIGSPLTKFDHVEFTSMDHKKMKRILTDKTSLLGNYDVENLIDSKVKTPSIFETDAVSGATRKSVANEVVEGAVYSTYTLWHIVNGKIAGKILNYTESIIDDPLLVRMLKSNNHYYQYYALHKIQAGKEEYWPLIIRLISKGNAYVPFFAIDKLPEDAWDSPQYQEKLVNLLMDVGFKVQNELLNELKNYKLSEGALTKLVINLEVLTENQTIKALGILEKNRSIISHKSLLCLSYLLENKNKEISKMTFLILKSRSEESKEIKNKLDQFEKKIN